ncbi:MAG: oxygen-independent coproporphyrinogen III oxidase [Leptospira sp.]|nr:oxygen-independent coproporphyrinogen III oxidase [Leptospira sp.]
MDSRLIAKYDIPAPRYTSYPTVPYWSDSPTTSEWLEHVRNSISGENASFAMYLHIPFCETLCTFCGCNTSITKNHSVENPYIEAVTSEFNHYIAEIPELSKVELKELHLGGGTPTYLSEANLKLLLGNILSRLNVSRHPEFSIEVNPRRTRKTHLEVLREFGFTRISLGVQDFDQEVQRLINRNQTFDETKATTDDARSLGFNSVNFDLIYGLPRQTKESVRKTIAQTLELRPDRIAFYSYAHVPWIKAAQRLFTEEDLPRGEEKRALYEIGRELFEKNGYAEIGMDHFALKTDGLWKSHERGHLHRNFMGYTENRTDLLLGLGVSAISDSGTCFHQNEKILKKYEKKTMAGEFATLRGHKLSGEDIQQRNSILDLSTKWEVTLAPDIAEIVKNYLKVLEEDSLIRWEGVKLIITESGKPFLRNICMGLDFKLREHSPEMKVFSQAI